MSDPLERIEGKLDALSAQVQEALSTQAVHTDRWERDWPKVEALEKRMSALEHWRAWQMGAAAALGAAGGGVVALLTHFTAH